LCMSIVLGTKLADRYDCQYSPFGIFIFALTHSFDVDRLIAAFVILHYDM